VRLVYRGGPELEGDSMLDRQQHFIAEYDWIRTSLMYEPRGHAMMSGSILYPSNRDDCDIGVLFIETSGCLPMCGHGTIGVGVTLGHLGRIAAGQHMLETPVGKVPFEYDGSHTVALENVASYRLAANVTVQVEGLGKITGDVAWGGNWFYLVRDHQETLELKNVARLTEVALGIKAALRRQGITGEQGAEIDHVELFGPPQDSLNNSRNFVLCPGGAYDRSPCGTGTSAKLACLAADGRLSPGEVWRQESILGSVFEASFRQQGDAILPRIAGQAHVTAEATLLVDDQDPLAWGVGR